MDKKLQLNRKLITAAAKIVKIDYNMTLKDGTKCTHRGYWNPLKNNADCFELETICNINIKWWNDSVTAGETLEFFYDYKMDKNATRRRASVIEATKNIDLDKIYNEDKALEEISDKIRQGIPVVITDALAAIDYHEKKKEEKKKMNIVKRFFFWFLCI
jgi:hypothetical protein